MKKEEKLIDIFEAVKYNRQLIIKMMLEKKLNEVILLSPICTSINKVVTTFKSVSFSLNNEKLCYDYENLYENNFYIDFEMDVMTEYRILTAVHALLSPKPWEKIRKKK